MTDAVPAVALLFDDTELGAQLRDALCERGARIVHEGGIASLSRQRLQEVGADVLVVNLDDTAEDALDQLYDLIDGDRPRMVLMMRKPRAHLLAGIAIVGHGILRSRYCRQAILIHRVPSMHGRWTFPSLRRALRRK